MKPPVHRKPKIGSHSYLGKNFSGKGGRFGSKLYKGIKRKEGESLENAFLKLEQETIKDCVDITTEYLREKLMIERCDICRQTLFHYPSAREYATAPKRHARRIKVGKVYIGWHQDCLRAEIARIWKEIFQAQELKRKL